MLTEDDSASEPPYVERRRGPRVMQPPIGLDEPTAAIRVPLRFATESLPPGQQFSAWQKHMEVLFDTRLPDGVDPRDGFIVQQTVWPLDGMLLAQQTAPAFSYERSANMVRFNPVDHWQITILHAGQTWTRVDDRVSHNQPGLVEIRSLGYPFCGRTLAHDSTTLIVPVDLFTERGNLPKASNNISLGGHRAKLLSDHISSIETSLDRLTPSDLTGISSRLRDMVFDFVTPLVERGDSDSESFQIGIVTRARRFILSNLSSPDLTPASLARELAISRTRLYELFEASGGVTKYIRQHRLSAAHAMLSAASGRRTVAEVGLATGYDSAANFSRAFTQQFGYSPSSIRKHASEIRHVGETGKTPATFESLVRTLGLF